MPCCTWGTGGIWLLIITGAAGFIDSNLAVQLALMSYDLWLVDHPLTLAAGSPHERSGYNRGGVGLVDGDTGTRSRICVKEPSHAKMALYRWHWRRRTLWG